MEAGRSDHINTSTRIAGAAPSSSTTTSFFSSSPYAPPSLPPFPPPPARADETGASFPPTQPIRRSGRERSPHRPQTPSPSPSPPRPNVHVTHPAAALALAFVVADGGYGGRRKNVMARTGLCWAGLGWAGRASIGLLVRARGRDVRTSAPYL